MRKGISIYLSLALMWPVSAYAKETNNGQAIGDRTSRPKVELVKNNSHLFLSGKLSDKQTAGKDAALRFLKKNSNLINNHNAGKELRFEKAQKDQTGDTFVKFSQVIGGVKVENSLVNVHFDKDGTVASVNGKIDSNSKIENISSNTISDSDAVKIAEKQFKYDTLKYEPKAEKVILGMNGKNYEVYKINIFYISPSIGNYDVYVDVSTGKVIKIENNIRYDGITTGTGIDVLGNTVNLNLYLLKGLYQMRDMSRQQSETSGIDTYNLNYRGYSRNDTLNGIIVSNTNNYFNREEDKAAVSAQNNAGKVIDFYKNLFDRNSLDGKGMQIYSYVHYKSNYDNAFWDGSEMVYGDGDGEEWGYLSGDLSIVGHEMTHGVVEHTANLGGDNQPGALNESIADTFGVLISTYNKYNVASGGTWIFDPSDWVVGDKVYTPGVPGDALRSLSDPALYGQPDNMKDYDNEPDTEEGDYGGVHANCGITSKAAYLIASSIGMQKTASMYYRALTDYMSPTTDFLDARNCLVQAASDLYGENSSEVSVVDEAFTSVGIGRAVTGISLDKAAVNLKVGESLQLTAKVEPADATNKSLSWTSSDSTIVKADSNGKITGISPGTAVITVKTADGGYTAQYNITVSLSVPTFLKAVSLSYNSIGISWSAADNATGYEIYRATSENGTYSLINSAKSLSYKDEGLTTGKTYYYKIKAYKIGESGNEYSGFSEIVSTKSKLGIPQKLTAAKSGKSKIELKWNKTSGASGYVVYRATSAKGSYTKVVITNGISYISKNLIKQKTYYYKIKAYRTVEGQKVYSDFSLGVHVKI